MKFAVITLFSVIISVLISHHSAENAPALPVEDSGLQNQITPAAPPSSEKKSGGLPEIPLNFAQAFIKTFFIIIISEIGDKTFFIAAIMAMKHPRVMVFFGAISALAFMTIISVLCGWAFSIIPKLYTYYGSVALFLIFGLKMIYDGMKMSPNEAQEEYDEVQAELRKREEEFEKEILTKDIETGYRKNTSKKKIFQMLSHIIVQAFTLTFLAEWGDRSQISTMALAIKDDKLGITIGGIAGHSVCTGLAVLGGRFVAQKISVKTVTIVGGFVFILFAIITLFLENSESPSL